VVSVIQLERTEGMGPPYTRNEGLSTVWNGIGGHGVGPLDISRLSVHGGSVGGENLDTTRNGAADGLIDLWNTGSPSMYFCGGNGSLTDGGLSPSAALSQVKNI